MTTVPAVCNSLTEGDEDARSKIRHARQMNRADRPWTKLDGSICRSESGAMYFFAAFMSFPDGVRILNRFKSDTENFYAVPIWRRSQP